MRAREIPLISQTEAIRFLQKQANVRRDALGVTLRELIRCLNYDDAVGASGKAFEAAVLVTSLVPWDERSPFDSALMHFQLYA